MHDGHYYNKQNSSLDTHHKNLFCAYTLDYSDSKFQEASGIVSSTWHV